MNANNIRKLIKLIASREVSENGESTWQTKKGKFTWDFGIPIIEPKGSKGCGSVGCLVGLAFANELIPYYGRNEIITFTDLDDYTVARVFYNRHDNYHVGDDWRNVTPEMVSRELEKLLISSVSGEGSAK
jgi:hypothetical protein